MTTALDRHAAAATAVRMNLEHVEKLEAKVKKQRRHARRVSGSVSIAALERSIALLDKARDDLAESIEHLERIVEE